LDVKKLSEQPSTYEKVRSLVGINGTIEVQFKGMDSPVSLYDVAGIEGEYQVSLPEKTSDSFTDLDQPLPVICFAVEGKAVSEIDIPGNIMRLGETSAEVSLTHKVEVRSNLKIVLGQDGAPDLSHVYAKVVSLDQADPDSSNVRVRVEFTWLPEDVKEFFGKKRS